MSRALRDVNVLLALLDADHVDHRRAWTCFEGEVGGGWSSCALTENGFVRIISQTRNPSPVPPAQAIGLLADARDGSDHGFWPCDVNVLDRERVRRDRVNGPRQVTDAYLLALAVSRGGRLVTLDHSVPSSAVPGATGACLVVLELQDGVTKGGRMRATRSRAAV